MKAKLCKCNNCDTVMIDQNPKSDTPEFEIPDNATDMQFIDAASGGFWACPVCEDDGYLMDITEESQLPAPSTHVEDKQTESNKQPLYKVLKPEAFLKENKKVILNGAFVGDFIEAEVFTLYSMPLYEENIKLREQLGRLKGIARTVRFWFSNEANYPEGTNGYIIVKDIDAALKQTEQ